MLDNRIDGRNCTDAWLQVRQIDGERKIKVFLGQGNRTNKQSDQSAHLYRCTRAAWSRAPRRGNPTSEVSANDISWQDVSTCRCSSLDTRRWVSCDPTHAQATAGVHSTSFTVKYNSKRPHKRQEKQVTHRQVITYASNHLRKHIRTCWTDK